MSSPNSALTRRQAAVRPYRAALPSATAARPCRPARRRVPDLRAPSRRASGTPATLARSGGSRRPSARGRSLLTGRAWEIWPVAYPGLLAPEGIHPDHHRAVPGLDEHYLGGLHGKGLQRADRQAGGSGTAGGAAVLLSSASVRCDGPGAGGRPRAIAGTRQNPDVGWSRMGCGRSASSGPPPSEQAAAWPGSSGVNAAGLTPIGPPPNRARQRGP
jgi:hypothetical protein